MHSYSRKGDRLKGKGQRAKEETGKKGISKVGGKARAWKGVRGKRAARLWRAAPWGKA